MMARVVEFSKKVPQFVIGVIKVIYIYNLFLDYFLEYFFSRYVDKYLIKYLIRNTAETVYSYSNGRMLRDIILQRKP